MRMNERKILYVMRGLPGSGKTKRAKELVGDGIIHSVDDYHIKDGKYEFDIDNLRKYHYLNFMASVESMKKGITPIVIDNTNITASNCRNYVDAGRTYGYEIQVVEPNTPWAFNLEELVKRNTHEAPREVIEAMLFSYEEVQVFKKKLGIK